MGAPARPKEVHERKPCHRIGSRHDPERVAHNDEGEKFLNGLPPPWSFPSVRFTLRRIVATGDVLSLQIAGPYLEPLDTPHRINASDFDKIPQSAILEGSLDALARAMRRATPPIRFN